MAINPKIKEKAEKIRKEVYGKDVREALASGLEVMSEDVEETKQRQDNVESQFQAVLDETTGKDVISAPEITAARIGVDGKLHANLKRRLDDEHERITEKLLETDQKIDLMNNKIERVKFSELQEPIYIAHRGGANIFPENTLEAYEGCLSMGVNVIELDVQQLADGALAVMHDTTMDRTTNRSGNVRNYSTMGFKRAKVDILPGWDDVHPPLLEEVLSRFGNNAIYFIESKDTKSCKKIAETIKKYRLEEYTCIQSFCLTDLLEVVDEEVSLMYLSNSADPQQIKSNNIDYIGVSTSATESYIQSCILAGLKVFVYTVNRRYDRDYFLNLGVSGFFTDEPLYVQGKSPVLSMDPFGEQVFTHGMIACPQVSQYHNGERGEFKLPDKFGWYTTKLENDFLSFCLQGWAGVLPHNFTLNAKIILEESAYDNAWASIAFCTPTDYWDDENSTGLSRGYHLLLRENGNLQLYRRDGNVTNIIGEVSTNGWNVGQTAEISIQVKQNEIIVKRIDTNQQFAVQDTTYRNGYLHLGRRALAVSFKDVSIS